MRVPLLLSAVLLAVCCTISAQVTFVENAYSANVDEDVIVGTVVVQVVATSSGDAPTFAVTAGPAGIVSVLSNGNVVTNQALDYETVSQYVFTIEGTANGQSSSVQFTMNLVDVNDNAPTFGQADYSETVTQYGTWLPAIAISTTDPDSGVRGEVTYSIISGNALNHFQIDASTGMITQRTILDMGSTTSFTLTVQARDGGTPALSTTVFVTINTDMTEYSCPNWMEKFGAKCYKLIRGLNTYNRAQKKCEFLGTKSTLSDANLATVYDSFRQDFIVGLMHTRRSVWIGLNDKASEGTWVWEDSTTTSYVNWSNRNSVQQPDGGSAQNCVAIEDRNKLGDWNDFRCDMKTWSVCQFTATVVV